MRRYFRFLVVGGMGMVVQLGMVWGLGRVFAGHGLVVSGVALEVTLLHNYLWHRGWTWGDRPRGSTHRIFRFHLSNGLVSLVGALGLVRLLEGRVPLVVVNLGAIVLCSGLNFLLGDFWAFGRDKPHDSDGEAVAIMGHPDAQAAAMEYLRARPLARIAGSVAKGLILLGMVVAASAQEIGASSSSRGAVLVDGPAPQKARSAHTVAPDYLYRAGVICGLGATSSPVSTKPTVGCGVGFSFFPLLFVEVGVLGPQANRSYLSGYVSVDGEVPLWRVGRKYLPVAIVGYSRLFETGHAFDYGLALGLPKAHSRTGYTDSWRVEARDYWTFANPAQHNVMLRVGWMGPIRD